MFNTNSDGFETTSYMGPQWQEVAQKLVKLSHLMAGLDFVWYQSYLG